MGSTPSKRNPIPPPPTPPPCKHWYDHEPPNFNTKGEFMEWLKRKVVDVYKTDESKYKRELHLCGRVWRRFVYYTKDDTNKTYDYHQFYEIVDAIGRPYVLRAGSEGIFVIFVQFPPTRENTTPS